jgi:oligopeptidase B
VESLSVSLPESPPVAKRVPERQERFGIVWNDDYAWLRDPGYPEVKDPEILGHLEAENAHFRAVMAPHQGLVDRLHAELKGRIKEDDRSVPVIEGGYEYEWRFAAGAQYRTWLRRPLGGEGAAEPAVILDENELAREHAYFRLGGLEASPDGDLLAYAADEDGSERFRLRVKDLGSGEVLPDLVTNVSGGAEWAEDGRTILYVELNDNLRPFRVRAHRLGEDPSDDPIVYEEEDPAFFVSLGKTLSRRLVVIGTGTHVTTELRLLDAADPMAEPRLVAARRDGHRYSLDHAHGRLFILTNDRHENFRLVTAPEDEPGEAHWEEVIPGGDRHYLLGLTCFADFLAISLRAEGLSHVRLRSYAGEEHTVRFEEPVYTVGLGDNREFETDRIRLSYTSMVTPASVFDYVVPSRELVLRKRQEIPSGYDPSLYESRRLMAPSADGAEQVPVTLVYRKDMAPTAGGGAGPLLLYGYGAYGHGMDPAFSPSRLSLLDRGVAFAIAHVRGGDELGWRWYREGRLAKKRNSFKDFVACADHLVKEGLAKPGQIAIRGGSAGGMLVGAALNMRPDLWRCAVLDVPFVDVLNTMLDASLPLTPIEWPEWGDPVHDPEAFCRLLGYSPYDNIREQAYPPVLVTAGVSDPRVTYWEPAKYVARMRATRTDQAPPLLLKTNMTAGHFGKSGRYDALYEAAEALAFVLACFGKGEGETEGA